MARCSQIGACPCVVQAAAAAAGDDNLTTVTGSGSDTTPYVIETTCENVQDCVGNAFGPGLFYDDAGNQFRAKISQDNNNAVSIGSDGGIFANNTGGETAGGVTVAGLPATKILGGSRGVENLAPENSMESVKMARNLGCHIVHIDVRQLPDGTLVAYKDTTLNRLLYTLNSTTNLSSATAPIWERLRYQCADKFGYFWPFWRTATTGNLDPLGVSPVPLTFVEDIFRQVYRSCVIVCKMYKDGGLPSPSTNLLRAIGEHGLQNSVIVTSTDPADLAVFNAANIATGVWIDTAGQAATSTPAVCKSAGAKWVFPTQTLTTAQIKTYVDVGGLSVVPHKVDRQYRRNELEAVGIRGTLAGDPVYASASTALYRRGRHPFMDFQPVWNGVPYGTLTAGTDAFDYSYPSRGTQTLGVPNNDSWALTGGNNPFVLQGWACPLANATSTYTLQNNVATSGSPGVGNCAAMLFICAPDDKPYSIQSPLNFNGYQVTYYDNLHIDIWKWTNGVQGASPLGQYSTVSDTSTVSIRVTPSQIILGRGPNPADLTVNDSTFRGPYWFAGKYESAGQGLQVLYSNGQVG